MACIDESLFEAFLNQYDDDAWAAALTELLPFIHEVDKAAIQIWFSFYPLVLLKALEESDDPEGLARELQLQGNYYLKDQIDSSHTFIYGHRYWPAVKRAVATHAAQRVHASLELTAQIRDVARTIAKELGAPESLVVGITAVGFMTLQQVGTSLFTASPGRVLLEPKVIARSPEQVLAARARDDRQGPFGFLRGEEKRYTVTFNESDAASRFTLINTQHLTTAAANDKRDYHLRDPRCMKGEGPIPVQCRSAACGTCWVGVLGGAEKLSPVAPLEWRRIKEFGYIDTDEPRPLIRLACQAQAFGAVSIVIPPWNGVFGRLRREQKAGRSKATSGL